VKEGRKGKEMGKKNTWPLTGEYNRSPVVTEDSEREREEEEERSGKWQESA